MLRWPVFCALLLVVAPGCPSEGGFSIPGPAADAGPQSPPQGAPGQDDAGTPGQDDAGAPAMDPPGSAEDGGPGPEPIDPVPVDDAGADDPGCVPACGGRACGDDGCGGSCGPCGGDQSCTSDGRCVGRPAGPVTMRFDVATSNCPDGRWEFGCPDDDLDLERCLCKPELDGLNYATASHFVAVSSDRRRGDIWAAGNFQAVYVDDLNTDWTDGGAARADAVVARAEAGFPTGVPQWFVVNEISAGLWPDDPDYRAFVIEFARALHEDHGRRVIIAAPFARPGRHADDWTALQGWAFVGAEVYLTGADVNASGNSVAWCEDQYQAAVDAYGLMGVPPSRLVLFEHFGNSVADTDWGRSGVSVNGWSNAIDARSRAAARRRARGLRQLRLGRKPDARDRREPACVHGDVRGRRAAVGPFPGERLPPFVRDWYAAPWSLSRPAWRRSRCASARGCSPGGADRGCAA